MQHDQLNSLSLSAAQQRVSTKNVYKSNMQEIFRIVWSQNVSKKPGKKRNGRIIQKEVTYLLWKSIITASTISRGNLFPSSFFLISTTVYALQRKETWFKHNFLNFCISFSLMFLFSIWLEEKSSCYKQMHANESLGMHLYHMPNVSKLRITGP